MKIEDKIKLIELLGLYQNEILNKIHSEERYGYSSMRFVQGDKSKYDHARIIKASLEKDISDNVEPDIY